MEVVKTKKIKNMVKEMEKIVNDTIKANGWDRLSSTEYQEFYKPTDLGNKITFNGKKLSGADVNNVLEAIGLQKREETKIKLTEEGIKYGRYVIAVHFSAEKQIVTDKRYAKYKENVVTLIEKFLMENPDFLEKKKEERNQKTNETKRKNRLLKEEESENGRRRKN